MRTKAFAKNLIKICSHANRVAISGHKNPDYDSICSCLAMQEVLQQQGITADVILEKPLAPSFAPIIKENIFVFEPTNEYDIVITVDSPEKNMLPSSVIGLIEKAKFTFAVDHHKDHTYYMQSSQVFEGESSACEVVFRSFEPYFTLNVRLSTIFYMGIYADTGGFVYSNTHSSTFAILSKLLVYDIHPDEIVQNYFMQISLGAFEMFRRAIDSVKFYENGQIAVSLLKNTDFEETKVSYTDSKMIVDYLQRIAGVKVAINIFEPEKGEFHISLRTASPDVDVSLIAKKFNGGGHTRASGLKLVGEYNKLLRALLNQTKTVLGITK